MEEGDERLLAEKGDIHHFVSSSCTSGKKGIRVGHGREPRPVPRNQSSSREGSGLGGVHRQTGKAWPSTLGPIQRWRQHPRGAALPNLYPQRTIAHPPMLLSTSDPLSVRRMKRWARHEMAQQYHWGAAQNSCCGRSERSAGTGPMERLSL